MVSELEGGLTAVPGFRAAGVDAGIKREGPDLSLVACEKGAVPAAALFTSNNFKGAPVQVSEENMENRELGGVIANSGCANAFTGSEGIRNANKMAELAADILEIGTEDIGVASTGRIGEQLPISKVEKGAEKLEENLSNSWEAGTEAAEALMTTDSRPKEMAVKIEIEDETEVTIGGAAKGAGMIHPDLHATMLGIIVTDAKITPAGLESALQKSADQSFNMITVDKDTSPNDTVFALANGLADNERITKKDPSDAFQEGLDYVTRKLAIMIAKDGEGSTHLVKVQVEGANSEEEAEDAARAVAGSNLVKATIFGEDPNWGRIVTALGYSGAEFSPSRLSISFLGEDSEVPLILRGDPVPEETIEEAEKIMREEEINIYVDLDEGDSSATAWGCDLTDDYVKINSRYRL
ncbi:MAG: bifunctional glutamate N-acetyltransferase/amino-acid acetyltransferase ArgJ [Candidatus Aenigmatarchaeota archaeon]